MDTITNYISKLSQALAKGDATEHTHRGALQSLMEASIKGLEATNEPKAQQRENKPDYVIRRNGTVIGYVEAKDVGLDLKRIIKSEQIKRYLEALPNLIVTNYLDFVWFANGEEQMRLSLGQTDRLHIEPSHLGLDQWRDFFASFCNAVTPTLHSPSQLAQALAGQTRLLRDLVLELTESGDNDLSSQHEAFKTLLVPELKTSEFADMYAQTATYGLFTARVFEHNSLLGTKPEKLPAHMRKQGFTLEKAAYLIPKANPFLREFFQHIANPNLSDQLRWLIEQIANSLQYTHIEKVLVKQSRRQGFEDPVFHFYETFLAAYDPRLREQRGVYYTPEPVVDFIVRSVDALLVQHFGRSQGLADPETLILDPATGTATFLRRVIETIHQRVTDNGNNGLWPGYVCDKLLPRIFGFELMMAPYTVAHLKLALQLQESGASIKESQRLHVYLTNTLDTIKKQTDAYMAGWISRENEGAEKVKRHEPVQVVLGNPPYSGISKNENPSIRILLDEYKKEPEGGPLQERKHWLNDDYVKFIRFAHDRVMRTGHGIVAFITNHGWLDNPTFRGMRASLMRDFDDIYVLDLHGNTKKKERTPHNLIEQGEDKNVFDIQQGVSITLFVKLPTATEFELQPQGAIAPRKARTHYAELWGSREHKYKWLHDNDICSISFDLISPELPLLVFVPRKHDQSYANWWSLTAVFPTNTTGIVTARDSLVFDFSKDELIRKIERFADIKLADEHIRREFFGESKSGSKYLAGDTRGWSVTNARKALQQTNWQSTVRSCLYRPFDERPMIYCKTMVDWGRWDVIANIPDHRSISLIAARQSVVGDGFSHAAITERLIDNRTFYSNKGIPSLFPLWTLDARSNVCPNINTQFLEALAQSLGTTTDASNHDLPQGVTPEDVLAYIYAVLHAPSYRTRYGEFLKSDFPRVPLATADGSSFATVWSTLVRLGSELIDLHLLRQTPKALRAPFPISGSNEVERPRFEIASGQMHGRVWINASQYFDHITPETWQHRIGGYQVCEKWLKDRKGRVLSFDDITHYAKVVSALARTQEVQQMIDAAIHNKLWGA